MIDRYVAKIIALELRKLLDTSDGLDGLTPLRVHCQLKPKQLALARKKLQNITDGYEAIANLPDRLAEWLDIAAAPMSESKTNEPS